MNGAASKHVRGRGVPPKDQNNLDGKQMPDDEPSSSAAAAPSDEASQEEELAAGADSALLEEEEKLRQAREKQNKDALRAALHGGQRGGALEQGRVRELEGLLDKANMWTQFLVENMGSMAADKATAGEASGAAAPAAGAKRKAGKQGGRAAKKGAAAAGPLDADAKAQQELVPLLECKLRPYQLKGIQWMISLYQNGLNGILADQMGLGKTVQTIGLLSHLRAKGIFGPYMVIGPLSTLSNWVAEFKRWCPTFPVVLYHGSRQERQELRDKHMPLGRANKKFPVVVTSYEIVIADVKHLQKFTWKHLIVDEGHRLKNSNCKLLRELRTIPTANKMLLTGTPLQNNLSELWSLLNFLLPDVFSSMLDFESWFDFSDVTGEDADDEAAAAREQRALVVSKLHSVLRPFMLRRIKADVEHSLPLKSEVLLYAHMAPDQQRINDQLRDRTLHEALAKAAQGGRGQVGRLNNVLMQMRKNCNHPDLITSAFDPSPTFPGAPELLAQCGKMQLLDRLLKALKKGGHKVLIFSQMTKMLDLLDSYLDQLGHKAVRIDGSIAWQDRQEAMNTFNTDPDMFVFLLSTRAGGLGINLTSADTVIIYDSDWNPHQDLQAMDRCHRIGQQKPVLVLRLATAHSVEGKLLARARSKLALERLVIKKGGVLPEAVEDTKATGMSADELVEILKDQHDDKDKPQSGVVSDKVLAQLLDRTHLEQHKPAPYPAVGVGYEVVRQEGSSGLLSGVE